ncbi:hypothetical protein [Stutzerimonas nitrititolerans]|uniref:hypothetical protein n=1 Tax=Stutzerimonas nitrititolerans TaxID=2482751 RepID=UPI0028A5FA15|nr:hypothetical protein [Stutzerimonas nitrititolerans]
MEKLSWRDRRISPDSGSLFQTFLKEIPCQGKPLAADLHEIAAWKKPKSGLFASSRAIADTDALS